MGRRTVLLVVAALVAALGTGMVFLYVRGADNRAEATQQPVQVLKAVKQIDAGEKITDAQAAGKIALGTVPRSQLLPGALDSISTLGQEVATATIYPNEQIIAGKFSATGSEDSALTIPDGDVALSVSLSDTGRVSGFISPGNNVAIFTTGGSGQARLLLPRIQVIAVGTTTVVSKTTTSAAGAATTEQLPKTLFTLAVNQDQAQKILYASSHTDTNGELSFGLLNTKSKVAPGPGVSAKSLFR